MRNNKVVIYATVLLLILALLTPVVISGYVQIGKGEAALNTKEYAAAEAAYSRAAQLLPWRTDLWERAGLAASQQKDFPKAIVLLTRSPVHSEEGWLALGYSYYLIGDLLSARAAFEKGASVYASASCYAGLALVYRAQEDWPAERAALDAQLRLQDDVRAHYRLGLLLAVFEPEKSLPQLMLASSRDAQYEPAVQTLRAALSTDPAESRSSGRMVTIGRALGLVQEWELSLAAFQRAIDMNAENAEAWAWLGEAQQQTGRDGSAALDRAVSLDHTSVTVRALRGLYWNRRGKYKQMLAEYLLAAGYEPQNPAWQASIGDAYVKVGDLVSAINAYQHATDLAPEDSTYWRLLAIFCADNGVRLEDVGLPAAQKAVELAPADPLALDALGFAYLSSGRFANAEQALQAAIKLAPKYYPAYIHLAMNYLAQGNRQSALTSLTFVRDADSGGLNGQLAEQLLERYFP